MSATKAKWKVIVHNFEDGTFRIIRTGLTKKNAVLLVQYFRVKQTGCTLIPWPDGRPIPFPLTDATDDAIDSLDIDDSMTEEVALYLIQFKHDGGRHWMCHAYDAVMAKAIYSELDQRGKKPTLHRVAAPITRLLSLGNVKRLKPKKS